MIRAAAEQRVKTCAGLAAIVLIGLTGCGPQNAAPERIANAYIGPLTIAVAPALNFSGSPEFDPSAVADIMASELSTVEGVEVIPVSRVLAVLDAQGQTQVASPEHARDIVDRLGADAILIFAVTEYDPYRPPIVGIAAQLYGTRRVGSTAGLDPVRLSREPRGLDTAGTPRSFGPLAQSETVFNAAHQRTAEDVQEFAQRRDADQTPFGWELYVSSQRHYLRYCCQRTLQRLFGRGAEPALAQGT